MLTQLTIKNLAIVEQLELNFTVGMHVITGETGAGKSIIIYALSIALGERAAAEQIRAPHLQAEVTVCFDVSNLPLVQKLLKEQELPYEECIIRRIINSDGRSRAYINGQSVAVQQLKTLAPHLVHIHSQHQHHALLNSDYQRELLDEYAKHHTLLTTVNNLYSQWHQCKKQIQQLTDLQQQTDRLHLLNYQIHELENLNLQTNELQILDQKHTQLAKAEELIETCQNLSTMLAGIAQDNNANILDQLHAAQTQINNILKITPALMPCADMLQQAIIQVTEANSELQAYFSKLELDPAQLVTIEQRLSTIHALARKLKVTPEMLLEHYQILCEQRDSLNKATAQLEQLQQQLVTLEKDYLIAANILSTSRKAAADELNKKITAKIKSLEMPNAIFNIHSEPSKHIDPTLNGNEIIHFMVTTNPGQPLGLLKKVASGGELSRISLAVQAITAQQMATPTLILDEIDVGISGKTAATVGALMRELSANTQILCITHLPQVAAEGHQHFKVEKHQTTQATITTIRALNRPEREQELARLMGGASITPEALAYAQRLLEDLCN